MKRVAFYSLKGGAGRTMALANVAALLAIRGCKVVVRDLNPDGNLHRYLGGKKYDAPFTVHGVTYADDERYAEAAEADYELVNMPHGVVDMQDYDVIVPVVTPGVRSPQMTANRVYPIGSAQRVLPFCSRTRDIHENRAGREWLDSVKAAFCHAGVEGAHFYRCSAHEHPYWAFFHEEQPLAVLAESSDGPLNMSYGYARLADVLQGK